MRKSLFFILALSIFHKSYAQEFLASAQKNHGKCGYIDLKGNWVIQPAFQEARFFSEGLAIAKSDGKYGFIDKTGNFVIQPLYVSAQEFRDGYAIVGTEKGLGMIDKTGAVILDFKYRFIDYFSNGFARVKTFKWDFVGKNGKKLNAIYFYRCESFSEGLARVEIDNKWGYIDTTGALVIKAEFSEAGNFTGGLAMARINEKAGFIDAKGNFKLEPIYSKARDFHKGQARVYKDGCWSFIDTKGKILLTLNREVEFVSKFNEGFARVHILNGENYINTRGQYLLDHRYDAAKDFRFGVAVAGGHNSFLLIDSLGNLLTKREFTNLDICDNEFIRANHLGRWGYMDTKGNWIIKPEFSGLGMFVDVSRQQKMGRKNISIPITVEPNDYK